MDGPGNKAEPSVPDDAEAALKKQAADEAADEAAKVPAPDPPSKYGKLTGLLAVTGMIVPVVALTRALELGGNIGRVQRNDPELLVAGLGIVTLAAGFWVASVFVMERWRPTAKALAKDSNAVSVKGRKRRYIFKWLAVGATVLGTTLVVWAGVRSAVDRPPPAIETTMSNDARHIRVLISASQLETDEFVSFSIDGLNDTPTGYVSKPVYRGYAGPDLEGVVHKEISTYLPAGTYGSLLIQAYSSDEGLDCNSFVKAARAALARRVEFERSQRQANWFSRIRGEFQQPREIASGTSCLWIPLISGKGLVEAPAFLPRESAVAETDSTSSSPETETQPGE